MVEEMKGKLERGRGEEEVYVTCSMYLYLLERSMLP